jgi:hypothetical protein
LQAEPNKNEKKRKIIQQLPEEINFKFIVMKDVTEMKIVNG